MIQLELVESTQRTNKTPRATSTPNPADVVQKNKGKRVARETSSPIPSLKFADTILLDEEDSSTRIEPGSHKDKPKNIDDDADDEMKDDKKDDDDDDDD
ncbi:hypothetical protein Tco_0358661, partial [Tanacetum coccineum]